MVLLNPGAVFGHQFNYIQFFSATARPTCYGGDRVCHSGVGRQFPRY